MTHGDKTKAKTVKSSKASGQQKSNSEGVEARKAGAEKSNGKVPTAEGEAGKGSKTDKTDKIGKTGKAGKPGKTGKTGKGSEAGQVKAGGKKSGAEKAAAAAKGSRPASAKEATEKPRGRGAAAVAVVNSEGPFITNPVIAASFDRAVKKYPNAFRKLTD